MYSFTPKVHQIDNYLFDISESRAHSTAPVWYGVSMRDKTQGVTLIGYYEFFKWLRRDPSIMGVAYEEMNLVSRYGVYELCFLHRKDRDYFIENLMRLLTLYKLAGNITWF